MRLVIRVLVLLLAFIFVENRIYLYHTTDGLDIEYYDCVLAQSLFYCRRPRQPMSLTRDADSLSCVQNGGQLHHFRELRSNNTSTSRVLHQWKSTLERVEQYSRYLRDAGAPDGSLCQCLQPGSFGKNCEYQLPLGETFEETLQWQLIMRKENPSKVQMYGDVVCYETLGCDSGALCLDWREVCDGIQNCLEGRDEENCDLLEMNQCGEDEYRCENGMCIPDEFFLDGEFDCLDWSDELPFKGSRECPMQSVSTECDDHLCSPDHWSCGDGECIRDGLNFLKWRYPSSCHSGRDQFFICETHTDKIQWTMPNGRCYARYTESPVVNRSEEQQCEYLLKCATSQGGETGCSCHTGPGCAEKLDKLCRLPVIQYPREAIVAPHLFFLFNRTRDWSETLPNSILLNGTMRCGDRLITVTKIIPFEINLDGRRLTEYHFCRPAQNMTSSGNIERQPRCHHLNASTDRCAEWNPCLSITRINDGFKNCLNGSDEVQLTLTEIEKSCGQVRRHRFRCSIDQPTCLSVVVLGDQSRTCENGFDELWFGTGRRVSLANCNDRWKDECSLLRQYIQQSWTAIRNNEMRSEIRIHFRSYCNTFWDLESRRDEDLIECHRSWICSKDQFRCQTGQCVERKWINDWEWDCADASDEHYDLNSTLQWTLERVPRHDFSNRSYFVPSSCNQSNPFLCLTTRAIQQGFSCFNLNQIGDGRIDCAGAMDERNTVQQCLHQSSMLGHHFLCPSTNTCIPYLLHCLPEHRCQNQSDDEHWCSRQRQPTSDCFDRRDFVCFDGRCVKGGRCNLFGECPFKEDEYMCDYQSSFRESFVPYREAKQVSQRMKEHEVRLSRYPANGNVTELKSDSISTVQPLGELHSKQSSFSPYRCNRGLGVLSQNNSIICFCPPQYYGEYCQFHADRLSVVLRLNLSPSNYSSNTDPLTVLQLLVVFLFNNETMMSEHFHLRPSSPRSSKKKMVSHFVYPHSSAFRQQRQERYFNRSDLLHRHPYSLRIELYRAPLAEKPSLISVWKYPIYFDQLPVYRFAKVLHFNESSSSPGEISSSSEPCQPNSLSGFRRPTVPLCLCALNRFGDRCLIEHDRCLSNPCLNNGSCIPSIEPDQLTCVCAEGYLGSRCQWRRPSMRLSLVTHLPYAVAVIQYFQIDFTSLDLILANQQVFSTLPSQIRFDQQDRITIPEIVSVKLYSSYEDLSPDLYLLSVQLQVVSMDKTTHISLLNRCERLHTFSNGKTPFFRYSFSKRWISHLDEFRNFADSISSDLFSASHSTLFPRRCLSLHLWRE